MQKAQKISGFPEWLPEEKILENRLIEVIKNIYESHGFVPIETPAIEYVETLTAKGVVDKEIYGVHRLAAEGDKEAELGLHFDLTVPFARYVATHFNDLIFPFRRYQLQKVWRGERPQKGRFREFYQFDADIVARDELPIYCDAEVVTVLAKSLKSLKIGTPKIRLNNRKLLIGFYQGLGIDESVTGKVIAVVDKLDKIKVEEAAGELANCNIPSATIDQIIDFSSRSLTGEEYQSVMSDKIFSATQLAEEGKDELWQVYQMVPKDLQPLIRFDFRIARGLDYYTGTIVESQIEEYPEFGSVGSGGRYDGLVNNFLSKKVPGVGISIGLTRLMDLIITNKLLAIPTQSTSQVMLAIFSEEDRISAIQTAEEIRGMGIKVEIFSKSAKLTKQIEHAVKKGIPYLLLKGEKLEVKNLKTGQQQVLNSLTDLAKIVTDESL